jgi:hypothetical protein
MHTLTTLLNDEQPHYKRPEHKSSARRKMWGEDGNDARLLSCLHGNE